MPNNLALKFPTILFDPNTEMASLHSTEDELSYNIQVPQQSLSNDIMWGLVQLL